MSKKDARTVLIVDNDRSVRATMRRVVEQMGYQAVEAERATRAVPFIKKGEIDAVLLDLHMPGPHGDHLLSYLKHHHIPIPPTVIVSGYLQEDRIGALLQFGVCGIVAKPFAVKRLMDELRRALEGEDKNGCQYCPQCGTAVHDGDRFCRQCGVSLERRPVCPSCHLECDPGDRFCGHCGVRLGEA
jgi:DNA-binding NtrC family response regulator